MGFVYGRVEREINPGKEHGIPWVRLQQHQPGIGAHHPMLALPDPWHKQDTTQHLVGLGTSLFYTYKSFRFLLQKSRKTDRQTDKDAAQHKAGCCHFGESPSQHKGEYTILLCSSKGRWQPCCNCWSRGSRLQQLQPARENSTGGRKGLRETV